MNGQVAKHPFNRAEDHRMGETGILSNHQRVELLDAELLEMSPIGSRHAGCVDTLNRAFPRRLDKFVLVRVQSLIVLNGY